MLPVIAIRGTGSNEESYVLRILLRIVTVVSIVKFIANLIGRRRDGGR